MLGNVANPMNKLGKDLEVGEIVVTQAGMTMIIGSVRTESDGALIVARGGYITPDGIRLIEAEFWAGHYYTTRHRAMFPNLVDWLASAQKSKRHRFQNPA